MVVWLVMFLAVSILTEAAIPDPPTSGITTVGSLKIGTAADCAGVVAFSATQASVDVINLIILILYRTGYQGEFLGVGGTWNLNEDKNPDAEIIASGVLVGFFIYTSVVLITYCFGNSSHKKTLVEIIMNFVGTFMFIAVGGTALHYWHGYQSENKFDTIVQERQVGLAVGSLCVIEGAAYLVDLILSVLHFAKSHDEYLE